MEKNRRPLLLSGLIISLISFSVFTLLTFMSIIVVIIDNPALGIPLDMGSIDFLIGLLVFLMVYSILGIIFSSIGVSLCSKPFSVYRKRHGYILTSFIFLVLIDIMVFLAIFGAGPIELYIIVSLFITTGVTLTLVGYILSFSQSGVTDDSAFVDEMDVVYNKIEKLNKLKETNLVSDDEYHELKVKYLEKLKSR